MNQNISEFLLFSLKLCRFKRIKKIFVEKNHSNNCIKHFMWILFLEYEKLKFYPEYQNFSIKIVFNIYFQYLMLATFFFPIIYYTIMFINKFLLIFPLVPINLIEIEKLEKIVHNILSSWDLLNTREETIEQYLINNLLYWNQIVKDNNTK